MDYGKFDGEKDDFHTPTPHAAAGKSVVDAVLGGVVTAGNGLISLMVGLLATALVVYSGYSIFDTFSIEREAYSSNWDLLQYKPEFIEDSKTPLGSNNLANLVPDYRAWLTVYDTNIDYPVLQGPDDLYYAMHDIYGKNSLTGAIYLAAENTADFTDTYNLIYGHHMDNGAMFGALDKFKDLDYFADHQEAIVVAPSGVYDVTLFAVATTDAYESTFYNVAATKGLHTKMNEVLSFLRSGGEGGTGVGTDVLIFDEAAARGASRIVALSTCASATTSGRLIVFGKMVKRDLLMITATGYDGIYDGQEHSSASVSVTYDEDTLIEYSEDGGKTWTTEPPTITEAGTKEVLVRATNDTHGTDMTSITLRVRPRPVTVKADDSGKNYGDPDPVFTATVTGLLDGDTVKYTLDRINKNIENEPGHYPKRIVPEGDENQGNYVVTYVPGDFTILGPDETPTPKPTDTPTPAPTDAPTPKPTETPVPTATTTAAATATPVPTATTTAAATATPVPTATATIVTTATPEPTATATATAAPTNTPTAAPTATPAPTRRPGGGGGGGPRRTATPSPTPVATPTATIVPVPGATATPAAPTATPTPTPVTLWVSKLWVNDTPEDRPDAVRMVVTGGGVTQIVTLTSRNGWSAEVPNMPGGTTYTWLEPSVSGYVQSGINSDGVNTVITNTRVAGSGQEPQQYTLTIHYVDVLTGRPVTDDYVMALREGQTYNVVSPLINGMDTNMLRVSGVMEGHDEEISVLYMAGANGVPGGNNPDGSGTDDLVILEDYGTPLGLNGVRLNTGDCFE